ncbi:unnamed protein product, partial [Candidula unifasciata]
EIDRLYAFSFTSNDNMEKTYGWDMFDLQSDFQRMGVSNQNWVATHLNKLYELCDTYPSLLYVPASATTHVLVGSSKFRSRGRLPVLSYLHSTNQAALSRCSQPLSGFSARCMEDEKMLESIMKSNPKSDVMYVVDTRPMINAVFNLAQGKGYEKESFYSNIKFQFLGIENIHVMRSSLQKLMETIIDTSVFIANAIADGISVLVHCSDGWDRTAQTCCLAQLMLDPYYRTLQGFMALIEKEWLSFGHKFTDRCGFLDSVDPKETSPVFTQFLECVWQIMHQVPCAFQFNERFLYTIHDHVYSCQFGTFIGNCEKDRLDLRLFERTYSLWGYLSYHSNEFLNPLYKKTYEMKLPVIIPSTSPQAIKFWKGMYNRFENGLQPREHIMEIISAAKDHSSSLEDHAQLLEKRVTQICRLLGKSDETIYRKLQGFPSMDSIDGFLSSHIGDASIISKSSYQDDSFHKRPSDTDSHFIGRYLHLDGLTSNHVKSDSESGFDESSSQMSRSGFDDGGFYLGMDASTVKRSHSADHITMEQLITEMKSVAIVWKSFCKVQTCSCATPLEYHVKKFHCWKCGDIFCIRCIAKKVPLPGHFHRRPVPVCKPCYKEIMKLQTS